MATDATNGIDYYESAARRTAHEEAPKPINIYQQQPQLAPADYSQRLNVMLDGLPLQDIVLPQAPTLPNLPGSYSVAEFFLLDDGVTGVLALGSFSGIGYIQFGEKILEGLLSLKSAGATRLIVDVVSDIAELLQYSRVLTGFRATMEEDTSVSLTYVIYFYLPIQRGSNADVSN